MDSASKRSVIRSPLEMLACDRTPPPPAHHHQHHQHGHDLTVRQPSASTVSTAVMTTTSTPQHQKIHVGARPTTTPLAASNQINGVVSVTRTTTNAQERIHFAAARQPVAASSSPSQQLLVSGAAGADIPPQAVPAALVPREGEEPSALMFMSPPNQRRLENGGGKKQHRRRSSSSSSTRHQDNMEDENMFSRAQAEAFVRRTLEDYEQRRDEEEERVLSDIKHEMKLLNEKREHAERHAADMLEKLRHEQEMVAKLEAQCMMLASTTQEMHDELLAEQNRAKELDIAGCHADDRRRTQVAEARRELEFERGQWAVVKDEFEKRLNDLHEAHRREMEEVRFRAHEAGSTVTELDAQLKASNAKLLTEVQQREHLAAKLRDAESALERTAKEAKESGQSLERKSTVLERREQSRADELRSAQQHSKQLEESIKGLNDDVRKKMHRIQTLEGEVQKSRDDALAAWRERDTIVDRVMLIHASVEALWGTLKSGVRQQVSSALDQLRNHHNGGGSGAVMASSSIRTNELLNANNKAAPSPAASGGDDLDSSSYFPEEELLRQLRAELGPEGDEVDYAVDAEGEVVISGTVVAASQHTYRGRAFSAFHQTP